MAMTRGTALVSTVARVVQLTGVQDLANLEADSELTVTDLLTTASDAIYDRLESDGVDPTKLSNQLVFERAISWWFLGNLAMAGYLPDVLEAKGGSAESPWDWAEPHYRSVRPKTTDSDVPAHATTGIPSFGTYYRGLDYQPGQNSTDTYWEDTLLDEL